MDATQWDSTSDDYLGDAPVVSGTIPSTAVPRQIEGDTSNTWYYLGIVSGTSGGFLISDIHRDKTWVEMWIYTKSTGGQVVDIEPGDSFRGGMAVAYEQDISTTQRIGSMSDAWKAEDTYEFWEAMVAEKMHLWWRHYEDIPDSSVFGEIHIWVPYWWHTVDITEIIWSLLRHHAGAGTNVGNMLEEGTGITVSEKAWEELHSHSIFNFYRQPGDSFAKSIQEMLGGTDVWLGMGIDVSGAMKMGMRLLNPDALETDSTLIDLDDEGTNLVVSSLQITDGNEYLHNATKATWGTIARMIRDNEHDNTSTNTMESTQLNQTASPPGDLNVLRSEDLDSIATYGRKEATLQQPFLNAPDWAAPALDLRWSNLARVITFTMGPRAFSFRAGDIINVKDSIHGLDGTESWLVIEMTYNWDAFLISIKAIEMVTKGVMAPDTPQLLPKLQFWYNGENRTDDGGSPANVTQWTDLGPLGLDANPVSGFDNPQIIENAQNGLDALDFDRTDAALRVDSMSVDYKTGWTFFIVLSPDAGLQGIPNPHVFFHAGPIGTDSNGFEISIDDIGGGHAELVLRANATDFSMGGISIGGDGDWHCIAIRYYSFRDSKDPEPYGVVDSWLTGMLDGVETQAHMTKEGPDGGLMISVDDDASMEVWLGNDSAGTVQCDSAVGEMILYHEALEAHEMKLVDRWLRHKWAIPKGPQ